MPDETTYVNPPDRDGGATILIVDDELAVRIRHEELCKRIEGNIRVLSCSSVRDALEIISSTVVHVVLLDKKLGPDESTDPRHNGIEAIPEMLLINPHLQILVITGSFVKLVDDVVTAMRYGAHGFALKGTKKQDDVIVLQIKNAINVAKLRMEKARQAFAPPSNEEHTSFEFAGQSKAVRQLFKQIEAFSESNRPVLITGESGTGKTLAARLIHEHRKKYLKQDDRPFIHLSIATLGQNTLEEVLFGREHVGGERQVIQGFFELANTGTLFIDEIADLSLSVQAKFLAIIDDEMFYRIGGTQKLRTSFKLLCATSKDLEGLVREGKFSESLYQRISTFCVRVPSLSERKEDIPEIVRAILPKCCRENNVYISFEDLPADFIEFLSENILPTNVRGIEDQIARLLVLSPKDTKGIPQFKHWRKIPGLQPFANGRSQRPSRASITVKELVALPFDVGGPDFPGFCELMALIERKVILEAKTHFKTNRELSRFLKLSDATITYHLKKIGRADSARAGVSAPTRQEVSQ